MRCYLTESYPLIASKLNNRMNFYFPNSWVHESLRPYISNEEFYIYLHTVLKKFNIINDKKYNLLLII